MEAVLALPREERYAHFVKRVADTEQVWGLYNNGWASAATDDGCHHTTHLLLSLCLAVAGLSSAKAQATGTSSTIGTNTSNISYSPVKSTRSTSPGINLTVNANAETVTYLHTDGLGSPVAKSNASGIRLTQTQYEAYGMTVAGSDTPTIGFTGHVNDVDTGLTYTQQRYYDPVVGRFLSEDPVLTDANSGGSLNGYAYANNNPYKYVDPDGKNAVGWVVILLKNGGERIGRVLASKADAVAARKAGENVVMETKAGAKYEK